ncbi:hypothetical protein [Azospirillum formosense]|uniref:hypothetical protein n=1 Tax=Azospirillum formosense TaxID=861533 RepID=UPI00157A74E9|nr:hypothetical protein [Azospirillum formosense]
MRGSASVAGRAGLLLAAALAVPLALAVLLLPLDPSAMDLGQAWAGPSAAHPLGCDGLGRDVAARLIAGTGASCAIAGLALALAAGGPAQACPRSMADGSSGSRRPACPLYTAPRTPG